MEIEFKKYSEIDNHYQNKVVSKVINSVEGAEDCVYQITEKIDGSNVSIIISKDDVKFARRTDILTEDEKFYGYQQVMKGDRIQNFIKTVQESISDDTVYTFYGELFGPAIQSRIYYGSEKKFRMFDMRIDEQYQSPQFLEEYLKSIDYFDLHAPIIGYITGLEKALEYDSESLKTAYWESGDKNFPEAQTVEGVVIKPYDRILYNQMSRVIFKKKNKEFCEKMKVTHKERVVKELTPLQLDFISYINESRMCSVVSKYGEPSHDNEIGKYISFLGEDAFNDFVKDNDLDKSTMTKDDFKSYLGLVGKYALPLIKKYL